MWTELISATSWMLLWFFALLGAYFYIQQHQLSTINWVTVLIIALFVRLVPLLILPVGAGYDIDSFQLVAKALLAGNDVYTSAAIGRHPYLPFQMYLIGLSQYTAQVTSIPFVVLVKIPPVISDVVITGMIYHVIIRKGEPQKKAHLLALLYALSPISVLVSAYHGQFDAIPVLLLLFAWYIWHFEQKKLLSAIALGFAILSKTWPIVLLPLLIIRLHNWKERFIYGAVAFAIPIVFTGAYILFMSADPRPMLGRALTHSGSPGYWGPSSILSVAGQTNDTIQAMYRNLISSGRWLILGAGIFSWLWTGKDDVLDALVTVILCIFTVTVGMAMQWMVWLLPFALITEDVKWLNRFSLAGTIYLLAHLYGLHIYPWAGTFLSPEAVNVFLRLTPLPTWIVVVLWAGNRLLKRHDSSRILRNGN